MFTRKLKILLKSWILAILFYNFIGCGKEGSPHPPLPKEKIVKEVFFSQIGEEIILEINIPEVFIGGKIEVYFTKAKNPQKKEMILPPEEAIFKKNNLIFSQINKGNKFSKIFNKEELKIDYEFSTFWGFYFEKLKEKEKTKVFQFLFLKPSEKPDLENIKKTEEGLIFEFKNLKNCKNLLIHKEISNSLPVSINLKKKGDGLFLDENLNHNTFYRYKFYCWDFDEKHLSQATSYEILYKYEFKPPPPEEVIFLEEKESIRIEFRKVLRASKYRIYQKCAGNEKWEFLGETEKNSFSTEKKLCIFGVSSVNEAGEESEIVEAKEF